MTAARLLNFLALSSLAVLLCSLSLAPVNALSVEPHWARRGPHAHDGLAKRKRATSSTKRCKPRPAATSSVALAAADAKPTSVTSTQAPQPTTPKATPKETSTPPPPPPPKSSPAPAPPPPSAGGKAGLGLDTPSINTLADWHKGRVSWMYTWSAWKPGGNSVGLDFVPMLWGSKQISDWTKLVVEGYATSALGFNEPEQPGQSNMSPEDGATMWKTYMNPLSAKGYRLISPCPSSGPDGIVWLQNWLGACNGECNVDAMCTHYYGTSASDFQDYITKFHAAFNKNMWVTELACQNFAGGAQCDQAQVNSFLQETTAFMDSQPYIERYAYFGTMVNLGNVNPENGLMNSDQTPNSLGLQYIGS